MNPVVKPVVKETLLDDFLQDNNNNNNNNHNNNASSFELLIGNLPAIQTQVEQQSTRTNNFIKTLQSWSIVEQSYSRGLEKLGKNVLLMPSDNTSSLADGIGLFKSTLLDLSVQASEYSKNIVDDILKEVIHTNSKLLDQQYKAIKIIDTAYVKYDTTFVHYEKSNRYLSKLISAYEKQDQSNGGTRERCDSTNSTDGEKNKSFNSTDASSPKQPRSRKSSWGRLSFTQASQAVEKRVSRARADSPTAAKALSFFGTMYNPMPVDRNKVEYKQKQKHHAKLELMKTNIKEGQAICLSNRKTLGLERTSTKNITTQALHALEALSEQRCTLLVENMRKICIYVSSRFANGQYDIQMFSKMLERIDFSNDSTLFVQTSMVGSSKRDKKKGEAKKEAEEVDETGQRRGNEAGTGTEKKEDVKEEAKVQNDNATNGATIAALKLSKQCLYYDLDLPDVPALPVFYKTEMPPLPPPPKKNPSSNASTPPPPERSTTPSPPPPPPLANTPVLTPPQYASNTGTPTTTTTSTTPGRAPPPPPPPARPAAVWWRSHLAEIRH
jgi:hypothetical protein